MTHRESISTYISGIVISLLLLIPANAEARKGSEAVQNDTVPLFNGLAVSVDLVGPIQLLTGDYGQYEAALRLNLKDRYFPVFELGVGTTDYEDGITGVAYKTTAPYTRIGVDFNILRNKHDIYRLFAGVRYAFTSFKYDLSHPGVTDPVWGGLVPYSAEGVKCSYQWFEAVIGVDAKMWGPFHLGWTLRYRSRLSYDDGPLGNSWYVPGFGKTGSTNIGGTFYVTVDI